MLKPALGAISVAPINPTIEVLFLCTGNYYRSRLAEELFNHFAEVEGLSVRATSLGFTPHPEINPGTISIFTIKALSDRGITPQGAHRLPAPVQAQDFAGFRYHIAMSETEHRPMMERMFPKIQNQVRFWQVEDLAWEEPRNAIAKTEAEVRKLISEIQQELLATHRSAA